MDRNFSQVRIFGHKQVLPQLFQIQNTHLDAPLIKPQVKHPPLSIFLKYHTSTTDARKTEKHNLVAQNALFLKTALCCSSKLFFLSHSECPLMFQTHLHDEAYSHLFAFANCCELFSVFHRALDTFLHPGSTPSCEYHSIFNHRFSPSSSRLMEDTHQIEPFSCTVEKFSCTPLPIA